MIAINEIFYSIQGESSFAGLRTVFVRTAGCHLRCTYCDTKYSYGPGEKMSIDELILIIESHQAKHVCLTGGEPLLQKETLPLVSRLCDLGYHGSLETSGDLSCNDVDPRVLRVIDVKTPDSGAADRFHKDNLNLQGVNIEFKFVICSEEDFYWAEEFVDQNHLSNTYSVLYSPSFGEIDAKWLANKILNEKSNARLHLQQHKYIWSPETRGV